MTNKALEALDLGLIFHPCSQMKDHEQTALIPIKNARGAWLFDYDGNKYLDAISSWWVNIFGHSNKTINKAIIKQLGLMEQVIFAGFSHKPAVDLAQKLVSLTPKNLSKIFFADNGSSAIEVALKMSFQFFANKGFEKKLFVSLQNSYHGETLGALAVSDTGIYKDVFTPIILQTIQAKSPALCEESVALEDMERILKSSNEICAVIVEPLVQCAGGMLMYEANYLKELKNLCKKYNVFLIFDEIAVGFGRTGSMFALEQAQVSPDFLCLSKGITGGYLPLSVVMITEEIYSAFYCDYNPQKNFLDSHSYTGNALACAAANATLDIFSSQNIIEKNKKKINFLHKKSQEFLNLSSVTNLRQKGMILALDLNLKSQKRLSLEIFSLALKRQVFVRPLGNTLYFMPPFITKISELDLMIDALYDVIKHLEKTA